MGEKFPNTGKYGPEVTVNLRIQSEYRKMRTRNNSVFGNFSRSQRHPFKGYNQIHTSNVSFC